MSIAVRSLRERERERKREREWGIGIGSGIKNLCELERGGKTSGAISRVKPPVSIIGRKPRGVGARARKYRTI